MIAQTILSGLIGYQFRISPFLIDGGVNFGLPIRTSQPYYQLGRPEMKFICSASLKLGIVL